MNWNHVMRRTCQVILLPPLAILLLTTAALIFAVRALAVGMRTDE
jgi:hypothetical protein